MDLKKGLSSKQRVELESTFSSMKKIFKILLGIFLIFLLLLAGAVVYLTYAYPSERIKEMLLTTLERDYGIESSIGELRFRLFRGFELEDFRILGVKGTPYAKPPLQVGKVTFGYQWKALLARRLEINQLILRDIPLDYRLYPDGSSNLDPLLAAFADSSAAPADTTASTLPVSIALEQLRIEDVRLHASLISPIDTQQVQLGPLGLVLDHLSLDPAFNYRARARLLAENAGLDYRSRPQGAGAPLHLNTMLNTDAQADIRGDSVTVSAVLSLPAGGRWDGESGSLVLPGIESSFQAEVNSAASRISVPNAQIALGDLAAINAAVTMAGSGTDSRLDLQIQRGEISLPALLRWLQSPDNAPAFPEMQSLILDGDIRLDGSEFTFQNDQLQSSLLISGSGLALNDPLNQIQLSGGELAFDWRAAFDLLAPEASPSSAWQGRLDFAHIDFPLDTVTTLSSGPLALELSGELDAALLPRELTYTVSLDNLAEGRLESSGTLRAKGDPGPAVGIDDFLLDARMHWANLALSPLSGGYVGGRIAGDVTLAGDLAGALHLEGQVRNDTLIYLTEDDQGKIPAGDIILGGDIRIAPDLNRIDLSSGRAVMGANRSNFAAWYDLSQDSFRVALQGGEIDLDYIMQIIPESIYADVVPPEVQGKVQLQGWLAGSNRDPENPRFNGDLTLNSPQTVYHDSELGIYIDDLKLDSRWNLNSEEIRGGYLVFSAAPRLPDYLAVPLPPTTVSGTLILDDENFRIESGSADIPRWQVEGTYRIDGTFLGEDIQVITSGNVGFHSPERLLPVDGMALQGNINSTFRIEQFIPADPSQPQPARISGHLQAEQLNIALDSLATITNLNASLEMAQVLDLLDLSLKPPVQDPGAPLANAANSLLLYDIFGNPAAPPASRLSIERLEVSRYQFENIEADLNLGESLIDAPQFRMDFWGGNILGNLHIDLGSGDPDRIHYLLNTQISSVDVSRSRRLGAQLGKRSRLSADFALNGTGISPEKLDDILSELSGRLNITKIEKRVTSNLLYILDPNGTDSGIQRIRLLLKSGYNVRKLSFELKNGFIYASLDPAKPWFAPFNLPPTIDFARLPIALFMEEGTAE